MIIGICDKQVFQVQKLCNTLLIASPLIVYNLDTFLFYKKNKIISFVTSRIVFQMTSILANNSSYSASFTGASIQFTDMNIAVKMLLENDSPETINKLKLDSRYIQIKSVTARSRVTSEFVKRFHAVPKSFWNRYLDLSESEQRLALLYVILKTYRLLFELQVNLVIPKYYSPDRVLTKNDVFAAISEVASRNEFVDSWSENTRDRAASQYVTILRQAGLIDEATGELREPNVADNELAYYVRIGEIWFLQACLLPGYRVEQIKQIVL